MIPVLLAASGGLFPALAGTLNIALEGLILVGAFSALSVYYSTGSIALSVAAAGFSALALSALHAFAAFRLRANLFITGIAVNLFAAGLCVVLSDKLFNTRGVVSVHTGATLTESSSGFFNFYITLALVLILVIFIVIYKTPFGYRLRACDKTNDALVSLGIEPRFYQTTAMLISGFLCGLAGAFLSLSLGVFVPGMSAGKGWIALVVIFLGGKTPFGLLAGAFLFSLAEAFSNHAQGFWSLPPDFFLAFPYVCALVALVVVSVLAVRRKV
jgi:simple sugar transport system permease protein